MPIETKLYKVLIASPGDVSKEREIVRQEINRWNSMHATEMKMILLPVGWETDATPDLRDHGQAVINRQLDDRDILIGIFWTRLGTPTPKAESGTAEEIERAANEGKRCIVYFSDQPVSPSRVNNEQYEKVKAYRKKLNEHGLTDSYSDIEEFKEKVSRHITKAVQEIVREEKELKAAENEALLTKKALDVGSPSIAENQETQTLLFNTLANTNRSIRSLLESKFGIQDIEDVKEQEISKIKSSLESPELATLFNQRPSIETIPVIRRIIEDVTTPSIYIISAISRYGNDSQDDLCEIVKDWIERLSIVNRADNWVSHIKTYPALLLLYALGISSLRSGKIIFLLDVVERKVEIGMNGYEVNILRVIDPRYVFYADISKLIESGFERRYVPVSDYLTLLMKNFLYPQEEEKRFNNWFDLFELLMALKSVQQEEDIPYMGSFIWREETRKFWLQTFQDTVHQKSKSAKAILNFYGSFDIFESIAKQFDEIAANYRTNGLARPPFYLSKVIRLAKKGIRVTRLDEVLRIDEENLIAK